MNALQRFHASWPRGVAPSVVEHFAGAADHVAPAMSLWSGAERVAALLASSGLSPGDRLGCALPPGVRFVQTLVACLMREVAFCPIPAGARPPSGLRGLIDEQGALRVAAEVSPAAPAAVCFSSGAAWSLDQFDAVMAGFGEVPLPRVGARLFSDVRWFEPAGLACAVWVGLNAGAELHVGATDEELHRLAPDVVVSHPGRLRHVLDWVPPMPGGLALIAGPATEADLTMGAKRAWRVVSLTLPP